MLAAIEASFPQLELAGGELGTQGLRIARERLERASLYELDARRLPFRDEFDVVCAFDVLEHLDDDVEALEQMRLAASDGGTILISVPQHGSLWGPADEYSGHMRRYSRSDLLTKVRRVGLAPVAVTSFVTSALPLMYLSRLRARFSRAPYDPTEEMTQAQRADDLLASLLSFDLRLIRAGRSLPAGGSLFVAARVTDLDLPRG